MPYVDNKPEGPVYLHIYDATNPEARQYVWQKARQGYYRHGVKAWWLDETEPEIDPLDFDNMRYHLGHGMAVANIYPLMHARGFYEGMQAEGEQDILLLCRAAWAGSQRYGAAVWTGDIYLDVRGFAGAGARRVEHGVERHPVVDDRHWRLLWRRSGLAIFP